MWAPDDFGRERGIDPRHPECLQGDAAEDRRAREVHPATPARTQVGVLIIAGGQVLIQAGERLASPPSAHVDVVAPFEIGGQNGLNG